MEDTHNRDLAYPALVLSLKALKFWWLAGSSHSIHSPFLFNLFREVIRGKTPDTEVDRYLQYRRNLLEEKTIIEYTPHGTAGPARRQVPLSHLVRTQGMSVRKAKLFHRLVRYFRPQHILELGTNLGTGAACLGACNPQGRVTSLEGSPELAAFSRKKLESLGYRNIDILEGFFQELLPDILDKISRIDLVYFDGDHREEATVACFDQCLTSAHPETIFVFDDIHWSAGMETAWDRISAHQKVTLAVDLFFLGLIFFRPGLSKQKIRLRF